MSLRRSCSKITTRPGLLKDTRVTTLRLMPRPRVRRGKLMSSMRFAALTALLLSSVVPGVRAQAVADRTAPCSGSDPEPARSGMWRVAFCNRTGHDLVLEFRDNDCPAQDWSHRGDVYRRSMRRDESTVLPLCYANERQATSPAPGIPQLRMPGGKGVVTTWNIVGDCGEHSTPLYLDARTFYDRGDYQSGITLLQYPAGAGHCAPGAAETSPSSSTTMSSTAHGSAAAPASGATPSPAKPAPVPSPAPASAPSAAPPSPVSSAATASQAGEAPHLYARIDSKDVLSRSVQVYGSNGSTEAVYQCSFTLVLGFSDGGSYQDHVKSADVRPDQQEAVVITRKYFKSVVKVDLAAQRCKAQ